MEAWQIIAFIIGSLVWAAVVRLYFKFKTKKIEVTVSGQSKDVFREKSIIDVPEKFVVNVLVEGEEEIDPRLVVDMCVSYEDLLNGTYTVPEHLKTNGKEEEEKAVVEAREPVEVMGEEEVQEDDLSEVSIENLIDVNKPGSN